MGDVSVISSSIVQPRNNNNNASGHTKIHLTPFDLNILYFGYPQRGLLFPKPDPETRFVSRLKSSLSLALEIYFPFAGRLVKVNNQEDDTVSFHIDCENDGLGAKFVHAESESLSVSDFLRPHGTVVDDVMSRLFPAMDVKNIDGLSKPLLAVQVTELKDGVFISFGYNHMVADGASVWSFVDSWSKICSENTDHRKFLELRGWFLEGIDCPIRIPASEIESSPPSHDIPPVNISKDVMFHFTKRNISDLKDKANDETGSSDVIISSLQALSAYLWRSIMRHSGMNREGKTHCNLVVDFRQRLNPPLPKECFGNATHMGVATVTVGDLLDHGIGWAALRINEMVSSQTDDKYKSFAEDWVRNVKIRKVSVGNRMFSTDSVTITSSPRFKVYNNDFGWGKPIAVRAGPARSSSGKLVLFQGIEEGSVDVQATLSDVLLNLLLADVEFLENVTVT